MTLKSKGYLLVDVAIAMSIFSIFSLSIFTFYKTYKKIDIENKIKLEALEYISCISMEIKHNLTFDDLLNLKIGEAYLLDIKDISDIKKLALNTKIQEVLVDNYKERDRNIVIKIDKDNEDSNDILNIKVTFKKYINENIYEYENIIRKYRFLE